MIRRMNRRGQQVMGMPYSTIFAIFLIVIFIGAAFMGIRFFLSFGRTADVGLFYESFQKEVDNALASQEGTYKFEIHLPKEVDKICFANLSNPITANREEYDQIEIYSFKEANVFLIPPGAGEGMQYKYIEHLDIEKITEADNPYCVSADKDIIIHKEFYSKSRSVWLE